MNLENLISEGKTQLKCMQKDCEMILDDQKVLELVNTIFFNKLNKNKINKLVTTNKNMKFCPKVNCEGYAEKLIDNKKNVICNLNNEHQFCFNCMLDWHDKKTCQEVN